MRVDNKTKKNQKKKKNRKILRERLWVRKKKINIYRYIWKERVYKRRERDLEKRKKKDRIEKESMEEIIK